MGRPNVGKSTLLNTLLQEQRVLVGPEAGLTRDSIRAQFEFDNRTVYLVSNLFSMSLIFLFNHFVLYCHTFVFMLRILVVDMCLHLQHGILNCFILRALIIYNIFLLKKLTTNN